MKGFVKRLITILLIPIVVIFFIALGVLSVVLWIPVFLLTGKDTFKMFHDIKDDVTDFLDENFPLNYT